MEQRGPWQICGCSLLEGAGVQKSGAWTDFASGAVLRIDEVHVPEYCLQIENRHKYLI